MREIVVVSGKGGTGKTSLTAAFADLARQAVICDLDVDAADLHLLLKPEEERREDFISGHEAVIDQELCTRCGLCMELCRFRAVRGHGAEGYYIDQRRCEGCKVCVELCPAKAVKFPDKHCGQWFVGHTRFGALVHARLTPGGENSGRLVSLLKKEAREIAAGQGLDIVLCDGAPGIGCPVISSLSGASLAVVVTEPTPSGRHDLERILDLCAHFDLRACVIINKFDLNFQTTAEIEALSRARGREVVALLPHDPIFFEAMLLGVPVTQMPDNQMAETLNLAWSWILGLTQAGRVNPIAAQKP